MYNTFKNLRETQTVFTAGFIYWYIYINIYIYIYILVYIYIYSYIKCSNAVGHYFGDCSTTVYVEVEVLWYYNIFLVPSTWVKIYSNYVIGFVEKNV